MHKLKYFLALLLILIIIMPLMMMVTISLNPNNTDILQSMGTVRGFIPFSFSMENYKEIIASPETPFFRYFFNSTLITTIAVALSLIVNSCAAFALAWGSGGYRKYLLLIIITLLAIPGESLVLSQLLIVSHANLLNTYAVQILPGIANAFFIFLFYQFFIKLPGDLIDAARIDGFSLFGLYWKVVLPLSRPVFVTVATLQFLACWNSYLWPIMVTHGPDVRPLSVAMATYLDSTRSQMLWGNVMAFAVTMLVPVIVFFLCIQRYFIASITGSAVKG